MTSSSRFWDHIREHVFGGHMSQGLVDNINIIVDCFYAEAFNGGNKFQLAYILATARHECYHSSLNPDMAPVREGFAKTNQGAINAVTKLYNKGKISRNYALPDPITGHSYYGRGPVQITHKYNYERIGDLIGEDLVNDPDKALDPAVGAKILVIGSISGVFTGKKLSDYIIDGSADYYNMRRVINGLDKAALVSGYAREFEDAINLSVYG